MKRIVDISHHNDIYDWYDFSTMNDIDGLMIRCGHGSSGIDKKYEMHVDKAVEHEIPFGIYLYFDGDNAQSEMQRLVNEYVSLKKKDIKVCSIAIDYEITKGWRYVSDVLDVLEIEKKCGVLDVSVFWYTGMNLWNTSRDYVMMNEERIKNLCEMWIARYNEIGPTCFYTMWQHTSQAKFKGTSGDFDESYISDAAYQTIYGVK